MSGNEDVVYMPEEREVDMEILEEDGVDPVPELPEPVSSAQEHGQLMKRVHSGKGGLLSTQLKMIDGIYVKEVFDAASS
jgi:hypothetical protein